MRGIDYWYIRPSIRRPPTGEKQKSCQFFKNLTALYVCGHAEPAAALPPHGQQRGTGASFRTSPGPEIIPTRCRDLHLKQFCLEDIAPAILIILIAHIVLAVRWMLIKILSAVINHHGTVITVVSGGCHPNNDIIRNTDQKIKILLHFIRKIYGGYDKRLSPGRWEPLAYCRVNPKGSHSGYRH